jgi:hypothetical protein
MKVSFVIVIFLASSISLYSQSKKELKSLLQSKIRIITQLEEDLESKNTRLKTASQQLEDCNLAKDSMTNALLNLNKRNAHLENRVEDLVNELEMCLHGPEIKLKEARKLFEDSAFVKAKAIYQEVINDYPASKEAVTAKKEIVNVEKTLEERREKWKRLENQKNIETSHDEFKGRTFYEDKRGKKYHVDLDNILDPDTKVNLYFSIPDNDNRAEALHFEVGYKDDDWLFVRKVTFLIDGKKYTIEGDFKRDHAYGDVYEWYSTPVNSHIHNVIKALMNGDDIKVRYTGKQYYDDGIINEEQQQALKNIYNLYFEKGGRL